MSSTDTSDYGTRIRRAYVAGDRSVRDQLAADMTRVITDLLGAHRTSDSTKTTAMPNRSNVIGTVLAVLLTTALALLLVSALNGLRL